MIAIHAEAYSAHDALAGIETTFAAMAQVDKLMHPTRTGSDLLAIHQGTLAGRFADLEFAPPHCVIAHRPLRIDLGGIAKGCAGGSVVELKNAALAASDVCGAAKPTEQRGYYHGQDRREIRPGSISAANATIAEAATKCLLAGHGDTIAVLLETFDACVLDCDISP